MPSDPKSDDNAIPRVVILGPERTARRLRELLADEEVEIVSAPTDAGFAEGIDASEADLVVVPDDQLDAGESELLRLADDDEAPGVVVLSRSDDPEERTRLSAAGASVLDDDGTPGQLGRDMAHLAQSGAGSGRAGPDGAGPAPRLSDFMTRSPRMRVFLDLVHRVAESDASLLLRGETGVGKSRLARAIHTESPRADEPFVELNCGAIPAELLEGELFGAEAGAYTGSERRRRGHFERAHRGTVFLDEVAELQPSLQVKLLTVLQRRRVRRLGGDEDIPVDVRVMAATNRDLDQEIAAGRFRQDLFYRLSVVPLVVPPLREHAEDIPDLVGGFLRHFRETVPQRDIEGLAPEALDALMAHDWPGNVRELANVIERAVLVGRDPLLQARDLPEALRLKAPPAAANDPRPPTTAVEPDALALPVSADVPLREARKHAVRAFERAYLEQALRDNAGHMGDTAAQAGLSTRALYGKLRDLGLKKEDYR